MPGEQGPSDLGVPFSFSPVLAFTCGRATGPHSRPGPVPTPPLQWAQPGSDRWPAEGKAEATCAPHWWGCRRRLTSDPVFCPTPHPSCPGIHRAAGWGCNRAPSTALSGAGRGAAVSYSSTVWASSALLGGPGKGSRPVKTGVPAAGHPGV